MCKTWFNKNVNKLFQTEISWEREFSILTMKIKFICLLMFRGWYLTVAGSLNLEKIKKLN